ncbi:MAG: DUF4139 domain-containing protein [Bacteroidales bacterium]|nr:DUF4139 domain-containing protein [Bacteroidales bacterium]
MKRIVTVISLLLIGQSLLAQKVKPRIENVVVYPNASLIEKNAEVSLKKGDNTFYIVSNSPRLLPESLRFQTNDQYQIISYNPLFQYNEDYKEYVKTLPQSKQAYYISLTDSIKNNEEEISLTKENIQITQKQITALDNFQPISSSQTIDTVAKMKSALEYYQTKMSELKKTLRQQNKRLSDLQKQKHSLEKQKQIFHQQYEEQVLSNVEKNYTIKVEIYSEQAIEKAQLKYSYFTVASAWAPIYDLKINSTTNKNELSLQANLSQQTCEDWKDVNLSFTNENPGNSVFLPELSPYVANTIVSRDGFLKSARKMETMAMEEEEEMITNNLLGKEFHLNRKITIPSSLQNKTINLNTQDLKIEYKYIVRPKLTNKAYLQALICDWQDLNLIDAQCNIYYDNKFTSTTKILPSNTQTDTLVLPAGVDEKIAVQRKVHKTTPEKNVFSKTLETTVEIDIVIKNNSNNTVKLEIEDQIPIIHNNPDIIITPLDLQGAEIDKDGILTWNKELKPKQDLNLKVKYQAKYPKGTKLNLN